MEYCNNCKGILPPSREEVQVCPHCGFAQGDGLSDLSLVEPLDAEDQYHNESNTQRMGKIALGLFILLLLWIVGYGLTHPIPENNEAERQNTE